MLTDPLMNTDQIVHACKVHLFVSFKKVQKFNQANLERWCGGFSSKSQEDWRVEDKHEHAETDQQLLARALPVQPRSSLIISSRNVPNRARQVDTNSTC